MKKLTLILLLSFLVAESKAQNPVLQLNGLKPGGIEFTDLIDSSKKGELTIASFNIRDQIGTSRTIRDYQIITDMLSGADVIVVQEFGAKGFRTNPDSYDKLIERLNAIAAVYISFLGEGWDYEMGIGTSPGYLGMGSELPLIFYKTQVDDYHIDVNWIDYYDLGSKRDMGLFKLFYRRGNVVESFIIGSVHTKPACPDRGQQLLKMGDYVNDNENEDFVLMGDFNFGYKSSCLNGYEGEEYLQSLHNEDKVFLLFNDVSYLGDGKDTDFRTNLNLRKTPHFYDQFLISKSMAGKLADNASLDKDCGWISFSELEYFNKELSRAANEQIKGFKRAMKFYEQSINESDPDGRLESQEELIINYHKTVDLASYHLSDHKPIWIQFRLY